MFFLVKGKRKEDKKMATKRFEKIGQHTIFFDQIYYLAYAGGKRELKQTDQKNWNKTLLLPDLVKVKEQIKLGQSNNPNLIPLKGIELLSFIKELKFVPFFDRAFEKTRLLKLTNILIYNTIKEKAKKWN